MTARQGRLPQWAAVAVIVVAGFVCYSNTFRAPFVLDDGSAIVRNAAVHVEELSLESLADSAFEKSGNRPLINATFALNYYVHGLNVTGYHVVNLVIHLATALTLYWWILITLRLPVFQSRYRETSARRIAFLAALIWVVHPVQTQAVTYVVQRATSLATLFYLATLLAYVKGRTASGPSATRWYVAATGSAALALASKEIAATLPFVLVLYDALFLCGAQWAGVKTRWRTYGALLAPTVVMAATLLFLKGPGLFTNYVVPQTFTMWERVLTEGRVLVYYLTLLVYPSPSRLSLDYYMPVSTSLVDPLSTLVSWALVLGLLIAAIALIRRASLAAFCLLWFFINLALESSVIMLDLVFEHRLYLPSIGLIWLAAVGVDAIWSSERRGRVAWRRRAVAGTVATVVLVFGTWTWERNVVWNDRVGLWEDVVRKYPDNARARFNLGSLYMKAGRIEDGARLLEQAMALWPPFRPQMTREAYRISRILLDNGRPDDAKHVLTWAEQHLPDDGILHYAMGSLLLQTEGQAAALERLEKAVEQRPTDAVVYDKLGMVYFRLGKFEEGQKELARAIALRPSLIDTYQDVAEVYRRNQGYDVAAGLYQAILAVQPDRLDVVRKLEAIQQRMGVRRVSQ
jgi:Tfp pilus assembly protein PilF